MEIECGYPAVAGLLPIRLYLRGSFLFISLWARLTGVEIKMYDTNWTYLLSRVPWIYCQRR